MRTGETSAAGGFPSVGNWLSRWGEQLEAVIVPPKVHHKSTPS
jgi:hypothetical protein